MATPIDELDGRSDGHDIVTTWGENENIRWKREIHDKGWSSPVIWGDQIWLTTARKDGKEFFAMCLDRKTGEILHDVKLFSETNPAFSHEYNSYASPTPAIEEGRFYAHFGTHGTACVDTTTGKVLWVRDDLHCNHHRGPASSVTLFDGKIYLIFDGFDVEFVIALDKQTGKTVWKKDRNIRYEVDNGDFKKAYATPAVIEVNGKPQLVCPSAEVTIAYDPSSGEELWRIKHGGMNGAAKPFAANGLFYLTSGHNGKLLAVKEGGTGMLTADRIAWTENRNVPTRPSLLLVNDFIFMVDDKGMASCLEAKTGKVRWRERLPGEFSASPVYADGHVFFANDDGKTYVVLASPTYKLIASNRLDAGCMATPAIVGDAIILRTRYNLYCIGKK